MTKKGLNDQSYMEDPLNPKSKKEKLESAIIGYSLNFQFCWSYIYPTDHFYERWGKLTKSEKSLENLFKSCHKLRDCFASNKSRKRAESLIIKRAIEYMGNLLSSPSTKFGDSISIVEKRLYNSVKSFVLYSGNKEK